MLENKARDPEVSLKSILGDDKIILNLRPDDRTKHIEFQKKKRNTMKSIT